MCVFVMAALCVINDNNGVSVMCMNFSELTCVVYEHFRTSTM